MNEEMRVIAGEFLQKLARTDLVVDKAFELPHRPRHKRLIDVSQQWVQRRRSVSSVVLDPASEERIDPLGNISQGHLRLTTNVQPPDRRSHGFERRDTDRRIESAEQLVIPETFNQTRPKTVPKEVKLDVRIGTFSLPVFLGMETARTGGGK
jgi:hypothetical protein